jgi:cephalosporin hydroxylase
MDLSMAHDDRAEFESHKIRQSLALGRDEVVFQQSVETLVSLDQYDYAYLWSWLGLPIIQLPADVIATQEVIWRCKPDIIIETGVARGGSMIFLASMMQLLGRGKVIGVDIDIRSHNRSAIEDHPLSHRVVLIEGPSTSSDVVEKVRAEIPTGAQVMVILDSDHSHDHVLSELRTYGPLVTPGQYLIVADTMLGKMDLTQTPTKRSKLWSPGDEPLSALRSYLAQTERFKHDEALNGKLVMSSSPDGYLLCVG